MDPEDQELAERLLRRGLARAVISSFALGVSVCMLVRDERRTDWTSVVLWVLISAMFILGAWGGSQTVWNSQQQL
jgi:hypothetical protein